MSDDIEELRRRRTGIEAAGNVRTVAPFDEWSADKVACAAGVHPSVWWPEWFNSE